MWVTSSANQALTPAAIALGNFDGVHRGHCQVIQPIFEALNKSEAITIPPVRCERSNSPYTTVVTFNPHPQEFFTGESRYLLTPLSEKVRELELLGVEQLVLLPFDRELAALSPQAFVENILIQQLQATCICVGEDFRFGKGRAGTSADLKAIAQSFGISVYITPLQTENQERISSSSIRQALQQGNIEKANGLLGRTYSLVGQVVVGQQLGRTIGFPTANLQLPPEKFLPRYGVYCVRVHLAYSPTPVMGVMNLGCRPTVDGKTPTTEIHLLDWSGDLYGQTLTVHLERFLRPEQKFPSLEALQAQITTDCQKARDFLRS